MLPRRRLPLCRPRRLLFRSRHRLPLRRRCRRGSLPLCRRCLRGLLPHSPYVLQGRDGALVAPFATAVAMLPGVEHLIMLQRRHGHEPLVIVLQQPQPDRRVSDQAYV